ncbi:hypothetical protein THAOC_30010, partial [Thalassiosira oceanica]
MPVPGGGMGMMPPQRGLRGRVPGHRRPDGGEPAETGEYLSCPSRWKGVLLVRGYPHGHNTLLTPHGDSTSPTSRTSGGEADGGRWPRRAACVSARTAWEGGLWAATEAAGWDATASG